MKKRQVVLYIVVMLILLTTSVYATISAELNLTIENNESKKYYAGDTFTVAIGLKNIDCEGGIKSIEGYIDIDESVLENITVDSIVTNADGKVEIDENNILPVYDAENIPSGAETGIILNTNPVSEKGDFKLVINLEKPVSNNVDLVNIKFKIRSDVAPGTYLTVMTYKLFTVFADDAGGKLELASKQYKIDISKASSTDGNNTINENATNNVVNNTPTNNTANKVTNNSVNNTAKPVNNTAKPVNNTSKSNNNTSGTTNKNTSGTLNNKVPTGTEQTNKQDQTVAPTNLPKTGYRVILFPIIVMAIAGLVFYRKYSKYNNYHE